MTRILVTGSRNWHDELQLIQAFHDWMISHGNPPNPVLVSGACPTGADAMAEKLWRGRGYPIESHPADWERHGRAAGPIRNREMVDLGADACLAFIKNHSKGASTTALLAQLSGIPTYVYTYEDPQP